MARKWLSTCGPVNDEMIDIVSCGPGKGRTICVRTATYQAD